VLRKYGLRAHDLTGARERIDKVESESRVALRRKLIGIEGKATEHYFKQVFQLIPYNLRPDRRKGFKAYDGTNNIFNLAYEVLSWKAHRALVKAKLEPYLGFLHSVQYGKPSLVCDFMELYRYLIDDFLIEYCRNIKPKDFMVKNESLVRMKQGKREYLKNNLTKKLMTKLEDYLKSTVNIPRIKIGKNQAITTLINEEALLFAKYLRGEITKWNPRNI